MCCLSPDCPSWLTVPATCLCHTLFGEPRSGRRCISYVGLVFFIGVAITGLVLLLMNIFGTPYHYPDDGFHLSEIDKDALRNVKNVVPTPSPKSPLWVALNGGGGSASSIYRIHPLK